MEAIVRENTNEDGTSALDTQEVVAQVLGLGTKGRQRMMGKQVPKTKERPLTQSDVERIQRETHEKLQCEFDEKLEAILAEFNARLEVMQQETGNLDINEAEFYRQTYTRNDGTFVDPEAGLNFERMEAMTQQMTLESGGRSPESWVVLTNILGPRVKGRERVSANELRGLALAYEEMRELDLQRLDLKIRELERRDEERMWGIELDLKIREFEFDLKIREFERRDEEMTREIERMRDQLNLLMQSLQNPPPAPPHGPPPLHSNTNLL